MITISTSGIGPMDIVAGTKTKGASKEEEKAVDAFASLMNMVSTRQEQPEMSTDEGISVDDIAPTKDMAKDYDTYQNQEDMNVATDKSEDVQDTTAEDTQVKVTKKADSTSADKQKLDAAKAVIKEVKEAIKDALGITDEELDNLLADMGIALTELMLGDNLKNFILQVQGATNVDLLVNESLANLVNDLTAKVSELINQYGFTDSAELEQLIADNLQVIQSELQADAEGVDVVTNNAIATGTEDASVEDTAGSEERVDFKTAKTETDKTAATEDGISEKLVVESTAEEGKSMTFEQSADKGNQQIATSFNQAINNTVNANINVDATAFTSNIQEADIIRQIIDQIKVTAGKDVQSMEVQLNPENLGKVYVNVEAKNGVMQAKIIAETEAAKNAIENNLAILKENFSNNELKVDAIEVMVATYDFFKESQNGDFDNEEQTHDTSKSIGGINVNNLDEEELTEEEELEVEIMKTKGNTVSYTA